MRLLGWIGRAVRWVKTRLGLEPRVVGRSHRQARGREPVRRDGSKTSGIGLWPCESRPATYDEASITVGRLSMTLRSSSDLPVPYELTVVVPRVEITERYVDGKLAEVTASYSSVTIARSPRSEPMQRF